MGQRTVLITGASSGIGEATALRLKRDGYTVYGAARRLERMKHLEDQGINILPLDVTDDASTFACVETIVDREGGIDVLVNNAGYGHFGSIEDTPIDVARAQYDVNVFGLARLTQLVLPRMRDRRSGTIVNISSVGGKIVTPFGGWYQSTKFAVEALSDALRLEVEQYGIDVIVIEPGGVASEWTGIATDALRELSGDAAYAEAARNAATVMESHAQRYPPASVVAETISEALDAERPRTRYAVGYRARSSLVARRWLPDRMFDRMIKREFE